MLWVDDDLSQRLQQWAEAEFRRLETFEPETLAQFVIATLQKDDEEEVLRKTLADDLSEFMENPDLIPGFLDSLFSWLRDAHSSRAAIAAAAATAAAPPVAAPDAEGSGAARTNRLFSSAVSGIGRVATASPAAAKMDDNAEAEESHDVQKDEDDEDQSVTFQADSLSSPSSSSAPAPAPGTAPSSRRIVIIKKAKTPASDDASAGSSAGAAGAGRAETKGLRKYSTSGGTAVLVDDGADAGARFSDRGHQGDRGQRGRNDRGHPGDRYSDRYGAGGYSSDRGYDRGSDRGSDRGHGNDRGRDRSDRDGGYSSSSSSSGGSGLNPHVPAFVPGARSTGGSAESGDMTSAMARMQAQMEQQQRLLEQQSRMLAAVAAGSQPYAMGGMAMMPMGRGGKHQQQQHQQQQHQQHQFGGKGAHKHGQKAGAAGALDGQPGSAAADATAGASDSAAAEEPAAAATTAAAPSAPSKPAPRGDAGKAGSLEEYAAALRRTLLTKQASLSKLLAMRKAAVESLVARRTELSAEQMSVEKAKAVAMGKNIDMMKGDVEKVKAEFDECQAKIQREKRFTADTNA